MIPQKSGILTTVFYGDKYGDGEIVSREINGLVLNVKRKYDENGGYVSEGKIYVFGNNISGMFFLDGDTADGGTVRYQTVTADGYSYRIKKIKNIYSGNTLHHIELEAG